MSLHKWRYKERMRSKRGHAPLLFIPLSALMLLAFLTSAPLHGQEKKDTLTFRIMGYNVENLFDCRHDTLKNDREFLPDAVRRWNYTKYKKKLNAIARVIIAAGKWTPPALVALCEVENDSVLRDLTRYSVLREAGYRYVITHSPDERGITRYSPRQRTAFKLRYFGRICRAFSVPVRRGKSVRTVPPGSSTKIERHNRQPAPDPHPPPNHHYGRFQRLSRQQIHTEDTESRNTAHRNGLFGFPDALPSFSKKRH